MTVAAKTPRPSRRRFDHDEARARYANGETVADLAREYGVSENAIRLVCRPEAAARKADYYTATYTTGTCERCGDPCTSKSHSSRHREMCLRCSHLERRTRFRYDDSGVLVAVQCSIVDCANGERWQPPGNFPRGDRYHDVREGGVHSLCRACGTRTKRRWRERNPGR